MSAINDPEGPQRAPAVPIKATTRPVVPQRRSDPPPPLRGPHDPANEPSGYYQPGNDNGDYIGSPTMPGFILGQDDGHGDMYTPAEYRNWLFGMGQDPAFAALRSKYGDAFVAYQWYAFRLAPDDTKYLNDMAVKFPGYDTFLNSQGRGGGGGGGGGSGGGATLEQQFAAAEAAIRNKSETFGLQMGDGDIKAIARVVVTGNWSNDQLDDYLLGSAANPNTAAITQPGTLQSTAEQIKTMASNQLVTVSDATATEWSRRILSGELELATVNTILTQQARNEFGWATDALGSGATMRDILSPARDTVARELEMNPNDINLMDDKWRKMVQSVDDNGTARAATLTEVVRAARQDAQYARTAGAARMAAQTATILRGVFEG